MINNKLDLKNPVRILVLAAFLSLAFLASMTGAQGPGPPKFGMHVTSISAASVSGTNISDNIPVTIINYNIIGSLDAGDDADVTVTGSSYYTIAPRTLQVDGADLVRSGGPGGLIISSGRTSTLGIIAIAALAVVAYVLYSKRKK